MATSGSRDLSPAPDRSEAAPVTDVVLFTSGVGCFCRAGKITGDACLELVFSAEQLNDLLKSMVVLDLDGGQVTGISYAAQDPAGKALQAFGVNLAGNPSLGSVLGQLGGVPLAVATADGECRGKVLGVETRQRKTESRDILSQLVLSLFTDSGIRAFAVEELREIRILDPYLAADLDKALAVLARSRDRQRRTVTVGLAGKGERRIRMTYLLETPVWKVSYRLVLAEKPFLQGWAVVDNTTDDDWKDVQLALVSGRPISFIQDLYTPLYLARPVVTPELYAGLRPVSHAESVGGAAAGSLPLAKLAQDDADALQEAPMMRVMSAPARHRMDRSMDAEESYGGAPSRGALMEAAEAAAIGGEAGELFRYTVSTPVSIARRSAAALPIIAAGVEAEKLSIYNADHHPSHPYSACKMKNSTGLTLMGGPMTVFDGDVYAGDAQVPGMQPAEERMISYALDLACSVDTEHFGTTREVVGLAIARGHLRVTQRERQRTRYRLKNKKDAPKTVIVEHPYDADWELKAPRKPGERTDSHYRFRMALAASAGADLTVDTQRTTCSYEDLGDLSESRVSYYVNGPVSPEVKAALQAVLEIRKQIGTAAADREALERRKAELFEDQKRIRADLGAVPAGSKLRDRYTRKLAQQEDRIDQLEDRLEAARAEERTKQEELAAFLEKLELE
ncbi:MAG: hypothetical protein JXQ29_10620 [Planctomycetes bacterium]|nr:hypothetical protein [Planctomycetota bacterium]